MRFVPILFLLLTPVWAQAQDVDTLPFEVVSDGLTAESAAQKAIANGPSTKKAKIDVDIAKLQSKGGFSAFAPQVSFNASYTRLSKAEQPPINFGGMEIDLFPTQENVYALNANIVVPLTDYFLTILPLYKSSKLNVELSEAQLRVMEERIALQAQEAYLGYVRALAGAAIAKDTIALLKSAIKDIKALSAVGQTARVDLLQAEAQLADAEVQVVLAESGVETARTYLKLLLGMEKSDKIFIGEDPFRESIEAPEFDQLYRQAYENRPEIETIHKVMKIQDHLVESESGGLWPQLLIVGNLDYSNPNQRYPLVVDEFSFSWDATVALSWSPNTYVRHNLTKKSEEAARLKTGFDLKLVEQQLTIEVTRSLSEIQVAKKALAASKKGLKASEEAYRARRELFAAGESTTSEVLASQLSLRGAKTSRLDAYIKARIAEIRLKHVQGKASESAKQEKK